MINYRKDSIRKEKIKNLRDENEELRYKLSQAEQSLNKLYKADKEYNKLYERVVEFVVDVSRADSGFFSSLENLVKDVAKIGKKAHERRSVDEDKYVIINKGENIPPIPLKPLEKRDIQTDASDSKNWQLLGLRVSKLTFTLAKIVANAGVLIALGGLGVGFYLNPLYAGAILCIGIVGLLFTAIVIGNITICKQSYTKALLSIAAWLPLVLYKVNFLENNEENNQRLLGCGIILGFIQTMYAFGIGYGRFILSK